MYSMEPLATIVKGYSQPGHCRCDDGSSPAVNNPFFMDSVCG